MHLEGCEINQLQKAMSIAYTYVIQQRNCVVKLASRVALGNLYIFICRQYRRQMYQDIFRLLLRYVKFLASDVIHTL